MSIYKFIIKEEFRPRMPSACIGQNIVDFAVKRRDYGKEF